MCLSVFLSTSFISTSIAQPVNNLIGDVVMPAPDVASMGKYVDIPVDLSKGLPSIGIPIYNVTEGPLSYPVNLSYHASGVKAGEPASNVGLGWSLNATAMISRTVRGGIPDEIQGFGCYYVNPPNYLYNQSLTPFEGIDTEPDIFNFSFAGYSGRFYFDDGQVTLSPKKDIKIIPDFSGNEIRSFQIITENGTKYHFGFHNSAEAYQYYANAISETAVIAAWYLLRIESADGNYDIDFNYESEEYGYYYLASGKYTHTESGTCWNYKGHPTSIQNSGTSYSTPNQQPYWLQHIKSKRLTSIESSTSTLNFVYEKNEGGIIRYREDMEPYLFGAGYAATTSAKVLDYIELIQGVQPDEFCKRFDFIQSYFQDPSTSYSYGKRLKLDEFKEISCDSAGIWLPAHKFTYDVSYDQSGNAILPSTLTYGTDHWGFFNSANTLSTSVTMNIPSTSLDVNGTEIQYGAANRSSNAHCKQGVLTKHVYPTGGYTQYTYEVNQYYDSDIGNDVTAGGLRISRIEKGTAENDPPEITKDYEYTQESSQNSSGVLFNMPEYGYSYEYTNVNTVFEGVYFTANSIVPLTDFGGYHVGYTRVEEIQQGVGKNIHTFHFEPAEEDNLYPPQPLFSSYLNGKLDESLSMNSDNEIITTNENVYNEVITQSNIIPFTMEYVLIRAPQDELDHYCYALTINGYALKSGFEVLTQSTTTVDEIETTESYMYTQGYEDLLPRGKYSYDSENIQVKTEYVYPGDAGYDSGVYADMQTKNMIATPIETINKVDNTIVDGQRMLYNTFNGHPYPETFQRYEATQDASDNWTGNWNTLGVVGGYSNGKPTSMTMTGWDTEYYTWTSSGLPDTRTYQSYVTDYDYYSGTNLLKKITDVDGQSKLYKYDELSRLEYLIYRDLDNDGTSDYYTKYTYGYQFGSTPNKIQTETHLPSVSGSNFTGRTDIQYLDGLGRLIQTVQKGHSTSGKDIVMTQEYDQYGRLSKVYNPFESAYSTGQYISTTPANHPYTLTQYYEDPLSREKDVTAPEWYPQEFTYGHNLASDNISHPEGLIFSDKKLSKKTILDGNGNAMISFTDKRGRQILERKANGDGTIMTDTYYSYDDKNRLKRVYPPSSSTTTPDLIFEYTYDGADNILEKKIPDQSKMEYKYDNRDLLTYSRDGNLTANNKWIANVYDTYGRLTDSGFTSTTSADGSTNTQTINAADLLAHQEYGTSGISVNKVVTSESRVLSPDGSLGSWITQNFEYDNFGRIEFLKKNHLLNFTADNEIIGFSYDGGDNIVTEDYSHEVNSIDVQLISETVFDHASRVDHTMHTFNKGSYSGPSVETSKFQYNERDQISLTQLGKTTNGYLQTTEYEYLSNGFLEKINDPANTGGDLFSMQLYYDHPYSGSSVSGALNGNIVNIQSFIIGNPQQLYSYEYDHENRLKFGYSHEISGSSLVNGGYYNTSFTYDDRGNIQTLNRSGQYEDGGSAQYNDIDQLTYQYSPNTNRIQKITDAAPSASKEYGLNVSSTLDFEYDDNGNWERDPNKEVTISYNHLNLPYKATFDDGQVIEWTYDAQGTLLRKESFDEDETNTLFTVERRDYVGVTEYVDDGLLQINTGFGRIYNTEECGTPLALTGVISEDKQYKALNVTSEAQHNSDANIKLIGGDFVKLDSGFEYATGGTFEASITPCLGSTPWRYEYTIKDHLGNTRVLFADKNEDEYVDASEVISASQYYPFGMEMTGDWQVTDNMDYNYKYNGKELHSDFGLDWYNYGARYLDPSIARWTAVDPLADQYVTYSPYNYVMNNPISLIDPDGMSVDTEIYNKSGKKVGEDKNGKDGKVALVSNKVGKQLQKEEISAEQAIAQGVNTTYTELIESNNVYLRTIGNKRGLEESSVVKPDGSVFRGKTGSMKDRNGVSEAQLPIVEGNDNTSIHSHPLNYDWDGTHIRSNSALQPGPKAPKAFLGFKSNIIVGRLGQTTGTIYADGTISASQPTIGVVFYSRDSKMVGQISLKALKKIIKNK